MELIHDQWSMQTIVAFIFFALVVGGSLLGFVASILLNGRTYHTSYGSTRTRKTMGVAAGFLAVAIVFSLIFSAAMFPWSKEYHAYATVSGVVAQADARLLASGDAMEEKIVILYEGSSLQFGCEDTRCATVRPGDTLTLECKRVWEFNATDGYDCKFGSFDREGE